MPNDRGCVRACWTSVSMLDLKRFKEVIISNGMHSPYVKQMLNLWATWNRIIPQVWRDLFTAVLESGPQLQWRTWLKIEANTIEQEN